MKVFLCLIAVIITSHLSAQTFRQMVLMADAIAICEIENVVGDTVRLGDYHQYTAGTTTYEPHEWLKKPKGIRIPKKIVSKAVPKKGYYDEIGCRRTGVGWDSNNIPTAVHFLQYIENKWQVGYIAMVNVENMESLRERINEISLAENIQEDQPRFYAMVDIILKNDKDDFITGESRALSELDSTGAFMQYYRKKGITELLPSQQDKLAKLLLPDIYDGPDKEIPYFYKYELIRLVYNRHKAEFDTVLLKRMAAQYQLKKEDPEKVYDYEIKDLMEGIYLYNKNIKSLNEAMSTRNLYDEQLWQAVENVLKETQYL